MKKFIGSAPSDPKIAVVASTVTLAGKSFDVLDASDSILLHAPLVKKTKPAPSEPALDYTVNTLLLHAIL